MDPIKKLELELEFLQKIASDLPDLPVPQEQNQVPTITQVFCT